MAIVSLFCLIYGEVPALRNVFQIKIEVTESVDELREKIWNQNKLEERHPTLRPHDLVLYVPTTAISTATNSSFNEALIQHNPFTEEGLSLLEELNYTFEISEYDSLAAPKKKQLHILVAILSES